MKVILYVISQTNILVNDRKPCFFDIKKQKNNTIVIEQSC